MWSELENKIYEEIKQKERKGWRKLKSLKYCKSLLSLFNVSYISDTVSKGCVIRKKPLVKWLLCQRGEGGHLSPLMTLIVSQVALGQDLRKIASIMYFRKILRQHHLVK